MWPGKAWTSATTIDCRRATAVPHTPRPTGIRTQVGVKIFGSDLATIEQKAEEIKRILHRVPGAVDLYAERITGAPYLEIKTNREAAARYGINVGEVQDVIETAIGGKNLTTVIDGRQRLPVRVRYARDFREDPDTLNRVLVAAPDRGMLENEAEGRHSS